MPNKKINFVLIQSFVSQQMKSTEKVKSSEALFSNGGILLQIHESIKLVLHLIKLIFLSFFTLLLTICLGYFQPVSIKKCKMDTITWYDCHKK